MLSGIVLSGGASSRMGREKGLTELVGKPLVGIVTDVLLEVADEVIISVARGMTRSYLRFVTANVRLAEDQHEGLGPMEGLVRSLAMCKGEYAVVAPCDTPFLRAAVCRTVAEAALGHEGAVPIVRGYAEPLHGAYLRGRAIEVFERHLREGRLKLQDACAELDLVAVPEERIRMADPVLDSFWNLNSAEELGRAETRFRKSDSGTTPS